MKPENSKPGDANQGEGDRVSARHYNNQVRDFVADGKVEAAARDAEAYVATRPDEAARAERKARRGPRPTWISLDELVAKGRTVLERARPIVDRAVGKLRTRLGRK